MNMKVIDDYDQLKESLSRQVGADRINACCFICGAKLFDADGEPISKFWIDFDFTLRGSHGRGTYLCAKKACRALFRKHPNVRALKMRKTLRAGRAVSHHYKKLESQTT